MRVIAQRANPLLVALDEPSEKLFDQTLGVVVDTRRGTVGEPGLVQSILARGYGLLSRASRSRVAPRAGCDRRRPAYTRLPPLNTAPPRH